MKKNLLASPIPCPLSPEIQVRRAVPQRAARHRVVGDNPQEGAALLGEGHHPGHQGGQASAGASIVPVNALIYGGIICRLIDGLMSRVRYVWHVVGARSLVGCLLVRTRGWFALPPACLLARC